VTVTVGQMTLCSLGTLASKLWRRCRNDSEGLTDDVSVAPVETWTDDVVIKVTLEYGA
jgi:hypothetical protein